MENRKEIDLEYEDLERLEAAFGEIIQAPELRNSGGDGPWVWALEASAEGLSIVRRGLGRCFNPDRPLDDIDTSDNDREVTQ